MDTQPTIILNYIRDPLNTELTKTEQQIINLIKDGPHTLHYISKKLNKETDLLPWHRLVNMASVHRAALTPTDILHFNGKLKLWNRRAAELGVAMLARRYGVSAEDFADIVMKEFLFKLAALTVDCLLAEEGSTYMLRQIMNKGEVNGNPQVLFSAGLKNPMVAVGAPAEAYFPELADRLHAELYLPEFADVANAVGTVSGKAAERVTILVKPGEGGGFLVHTPQLREYFAIFDEAINYACEEGQKYVYKLAVEAGASDIETMVARKDRYSKLASSVDNDNLEQKLFIESIIEVSAIGRPWSI